ncbi:type I-E CRISPR-associated protein Cse1/CasA [Streptomyces sp. YIM S03343]
MAVGEGFDLRDEPWIPVRMTDGAVLCLGLRNVFERAHEIRDLELPVAPAAAGLLRILAAMTARIARVGDTALGDAGLAESVDDWLLARRSVLSQGRFDPDAVNAYFDEEVPSGRFDLFDAERPFLQDPRLTVECVGPKWSAS